MLCMWVSWPDGLVLTAHTLYATRSISQFVTSVSAGGYLILQTSINLKTTQRKWHYEDIVR